MTCLHALQRPAPLHGMTCLLTGTLGLASGNDLFCRHVSNSYSVVFLEAAVAYGETRLTNSLGEAATLEDAALSSLGDFLAVGAEAGSICHGALGGLFDGLCNAGDGAFGHIGNAGHGWIRGVLGLGPSCAVAGQSGSCAVPEDRSSDVVIPLLDFLARSFNNRRNHV